MKSFFTYYQKYLAVANYLVFLLVLMSLAFPWRFTQPLFTAWLILWVLEGRWAIKANWTWRKSLMPVLLMCGFVGWEALSLTFGENPEQGWAELQRHLPVIAILLLTVVGANEHYKAYKLKTALMVGSLLSILCYSLISYQHSLAGSLYSYSNVWYNNSPWALFGEGPVGFLKHRSQYCIVLMTSLLFSVDLFRHYSKTYSPLTAGLTIGIADVIIATVIVLTGSRTAMLLLPILLCIMALSLYNGRWRKQIAVSIILAFVILAVVGSSANDRLLTVKNDIAMLIHSGQAEMTNLTEPRVQIYSCALRHLDRFGFFGVGFGASEDVMNQLYVEDNMTYCAQMKYGIHNRYLKTLIEMGPLALLAMLFILFSAPFFHNGQTRKDTAALCLVFGWSMLTENVITMIGGVYIFFALIILIEAEQHEQDLLQLSRQ